MSQINPEQIIKVKLDLVEGWKNKRDIQIKQADNNTRYLLVRLANVLPINIADCQPTLITKRADGKVLSTLCQVTQANKGEFIVPLSNSILGVTGAISFEVVLVKDDTKILSFPQFTMQVAESLHDDVDFEPTEDDLQILWDIIAKMQTATTELETEFQDFKESKTNEFQSFITEKDNQFQTSETSRQSQELVRQQAENTRQQGYAEMQDKIEEVYSTTLKYRLVE